MIGEDDDEGLANVRGCSSLSLLLAITHCRRTPFVCSFIRRRRRSRGAEEPSRGRRRKKGRRLGWLGGSSGWLGRCGQLSKSKWDTLLI